MLFAEKLGFGLLDTGCGGFVAGCQKLDPHLEMLRAKGYPVWEEPAHQVFRFGNSQTLVVDRKIYMAVGIGGRNGIAKVYRVSGPGPVLISNRILEAIGDTIQIRKLKWKLITGEVADLAHTPGGH